MSVKLLRPHDRILLVTAQTPARLGRMFMRPQEFYESPRFKGKFFTVDQFKRYYAKHFGDGRFTYYQDFQGYNMPGEVFLDWQRAFASRETSWEQDLLSLLGPLPDKFYLIGALEKDVSTIKHELSHAFFHLDNDYRGRATAFVALHPEQKQIKALRRALKRIMYREDVMDDELVSYILFEEGWMRSAGIKTSALYSLRAKLNGLYAGASMHYLKLRRDW